MLLEIDNSDQDSIVKLVVMAILGFVCVLLIVVLCWFRYRRMADERKAEELVQLTKRIEKWHYATYVGKMSRHEIKVIEKRGGWHSISVFMKKELDSNGKVLWPAINIREEAKKQQ